MSHFISNKICCIADIHIGVHGNSPFWHKIHTDWAKWLVAELKSKNIKDIVICGDFFDSRDEIAVNTLHEGANILSLFNDFKITILCGNHDVFLKNSSTINSLQGFKQWPNVTVVDKLFEVSQNGKDYAFVPWGVPLSEIKTKKHIIFGHFEFASFKMNTSKVCEDGVSPHEAANLAPLTISGHFHLKDYRMLNGSKVLYTGNPFEMDFGDSKAEKGYYIVDIDQLTTDFYVNNMSPKHEKIQLSWLVEKKSLTPEVINRITNNIVRVVIDRRISSDDSELLFAKLKQYLPLSFNVETEYFNTFDVNEDKRDLSGVDIKQAIAEFVDILDINNKQDVLAYVIDLYDKF